MEINKKVFILIADDDQDDILMLSELFEQHGLLNSLYIVSDGVELLEFLERRGKYEKVMVSPRPDLILLDLTMPRIDGYAALQKIKSNVLLRDIPIIIMTSSTSETDIAKSREYNVDGYLQKPIVYKSFIEVIELLSDKGIYLNE
ncbi:MAG: response regulator [Spirosomaceae bacterium]|nr:response regulator [Spirosomataceae bacterium]